MSIRKSLQNSILLVAVLPVIIMAISAYIVAATKYAQINAQNTSKTASDYSYGFSSRLDSQIIETDALANTNDIKSYLLEKVNSPDTLLQTGSSYYTSIKNSLTQISESFDNTVDYYLYDIDGYLVVSSSEDTSMDWAEIMMEPIDKYKETTVIANSYFTPDTIDVVAPIVVKNSVIGILRTNINAEYFKNYALSSELNCNFVIDKNGVPILGYRIDSEEEMQFINHITEEIDNNRLDVNDTFSDTYSANDNYIFGYSSVEGHDWIYVIKEDTSSYTTIVSSLPIILLFLLIIVIIISIMTSKNMASKYTDPIMELNEKMRAATDGQLDVQCSTDWFGEYESLSTNFNSMMDIISTNYNEISQARQELEESKNALQTNYADIERIAYTDALTGLYNRMAFYKYANEILSDKSNGILNHAIIFIDLDGFKSINDTLGHDYGDLLLKAVASKLNSFMDEDDLFARNGGDEFVILKNRFENHDDLEKFLVKLVSIADHPFVLEDETVHITLSAGAALFPQNGLSLTELMKNADIAMYASKTTGKNSYTFFSSTMEDEVNRRNDLIDILRDAIKNQDIYLLYQPQADIATGEIVGCEALMRLNSPIVGFVSPDEFIPVAEEIGLIDELGEWALVEACKFNQRLMDNGFKPLRISVNVSTTQLRGDRLLKAIEALPDKTTMPLEYLEIELTESVLMKNFEHNLNLINRMKKLGIKIALDDFETGYSSFSYLTKIPINTLKIDKSFIAGICENENDTYIAGTIINLAHQLGITVIAEGVETIEQLRILQEQMCDVLQGYFFSRAVSEEDFIELLTINS